MKKAVFVVLLLLVSVAAAEIVQKDPPMKVYFDPSTGKTSTTPIGTGVEIQATQIPIIDSILIPLIMGGGFIYENVILFLVTAASASILPFPGEAFFPVFLRAGMDRLHLILIGAVGAAMGCLVNYYLGSKGITLIRKYVKQPTLDKAERFMKKYGFAGMFVLFAIPALPVPILEPMMLMSGFMALNIYEYILVAFTAHFLRFGLLVGAIAVISSTGILPWTIVLNF